MIKYDKDNEIRSKCSKSYTSLYIRTANLKGSCLKNVARINIKKVFIDVFEFFLLFSTYVPKQKKQVFHYIVCLNMSLLILYNCLIDQQEFINHLLCAK